MASDEDKTDLTSLELDTSDGDAKGAPVPDDSTDLEVTFTALQNPELVEKHFKKKIYSESSPTSSETIESPEIPSEEEGEGDLESGLGIEEDAKHAALDIPGDDGPLSDDQDLFEDVGNLEEEAFSETRTAAANPLRPDEDELLIENEPVFTSEDKKEDTGSGILKEPEADLELDHEPTFQVEETPSENTLIQEPSLNVEVPTQMTDHVPELREHEPTPTFSSFDLDSASDSSFGDEPVFNSPAMMSFEVDEKEESHSLSSTPFVSRDALEEIKSFGNQVSPAGSLKTPIPFSVLISDIRFVEDAERILQALKSEKFEIELSSVEAQLKRGKVLIPRISEYAAMWLSRKLRSIEANLIVGPSDEILPTKEDPREKNATPLVSRRTLRQNQIEGLNFSELPKHYQDIIVTTAPQIPGENIGSYRGVVSTAKPIPLEMNAEEAIDEMSEQVLGLLRQKALNKQANALLGVQVTVQPLPDSSESDSSYQVVATGTAVRLAARR